MIKRVCIKDTDIEEDFIYIGRPSKYGNIYTSKISKLAHKVSSREEAIRLFDIYINDNQHLVDSLIEDLSDKNLDSIGCWCDKGQTCHGDIYIKHINARKYKSLF